MGTNIVLRESDKDGFCKAIDYCKAWAEMHQAEIGAVEMALGAGVLTWGLMNGHLSIGQDVSASQLAEIGGIAGMGAGASGASIAALSILKGLFVGGIGGVAGTVCVPALALIGGATAMFGALGYVGGDFIEKTINPPGGFGDFLGGASILAVGVGLIIDGARRFIKDERVLEMTSGIKDGVIIFSTQATEILAQTKEEFDKLIEELDESTSAKWMTLAGAAGGTVTGGVLAGTTVTVLGSKALGAAALSLGLVSAPVWPVVAGGAAGLALGVAAWKGLKYYKDNQYEGEQKSAGFLAGPDKN